MEGEPYQWEICAALQQPKLKPWNPSFGPRVVKRDKDGKATRVEFRLLICNPKTEVYLVGPFNDWGKQLKGFKLVPDALHESRASRFLPSTGYRTNSCSRERREHKKRKEA